MKDLKIIGRVEKISFPDFGVSKVHAKIDTGADLSSIWATGIKEEDDTLKFKLFGKESDHYTGQEIELKQNDYLLTRIANSFGQKELRYVVRMKVQIGGKLVNGTFTLSDRGSKTYPILIGRKLLNNKFIVDVSKGSPLREMENNKKDRLKRELELFNIWEAKS